MTDQLANNGRSQVQVCCIALAASLVLAMLIPIGVAQARWQDTKSLGVSVQGGTLTAPSGLSCTTDNVLLAGSAKISWNAVPGVTSYRVYLRTVAPITGTEGARTLVAEVPSTTTSYELGTSLLTGLLSSVLSTLVGGHFRISIEAVSGNNWVSAESAKYRINPTISVIPLSLTALACGGAV